MQTDPTTLLQRSASGEVLAASALAPLVYEELRRLASGYLRGERVGHTLQTTALVNEALVRLMDQSRIGWNDRAHFVAVAATAMRHILINHARDRARDKRGGGAKRQDLHEGIAFTEENDEFLDLLALEEALKKLEAIDPDRVRLVELRYFAGLGLAETAELLGRSTATVTREWAFVRAWLLRELKKG